MQKAFYFISILAVILAAAALIIATTQPQQTESSINLNLRSLASIDYRYEYTDIENEIRENHEKALAHADVLMSAILNPQLKVERLIYVANKGLNRALINQDWNAYHTYGAIIAALSITSDSRGRAESEIDRSILEARRDLGADQGGRLLLQKAEQFAGLLAGSPDAGLYFQKIAEAERLPDGVRSRAWYEYGLIHEKRYYTVYPFHNERARNGFYNAVMLADGSDLVKQEAWWGFDWMCISWPTFGKELEEVMARFKEVYPDEHLVQQYAEYRRTYAIACTGAGEEAIAILESLAAREDLSPRLLEPVLQSLDSVGASEQYNETAAAPRPPAPTYWMVIEHKPGMDVDRMLRND